MFPAFSEPEVQHAEMGSDFLHCCHHCRAFRIYRHCGWRRDHCEMAVLHRGRDLPDLPGAGIDGRQSGILAGANATRFTRARQPPSRSGSVKLLVQLVGLAAGVHRPLEAELDGFTAYR